MAAGPDVLHGIERDPVLASVLRDLEAPEVPPWPNDSGTSSNTLWTIEARSLHADADLWGKAALRTLRYLAAQPAHEIFQKAKSPVKESPILLAATGGSIDHRPTAIQGWIRPAVRWLMRELEAGASLQGAVERWIHRMIWLGPRGGSLDELLNEIDKKGVKRIEDHFQRDLQGYLFDQGIAFADQGRELPAANGRVDFLLRSGHAASVELKVWRDTSSVKNLQAWFHQAAMYPPRFGIMSGYLVLLSVDRKRRVQFGPGFEASPPMLRITPELAVQVRLCDLGEHQPSLEGSARAELLLDAAQFYAVSTDGE